MNFDFAKLKELNELDFEQISVWPREVKIVVNLFVAIAVAVLSYYLLIAPKLPILEAAERKEAELKIQFEAKQRIAINLDAYREQLKRLEEDFSSMLRSLPTSNETPSLLDDITLAGTSAGLNFKLLQWQTEIPKEFYTELPIKLEVSGTYHNLGEFTASIAKLSRIVTLHDFSLTRDDLTLSLQMQAKIYRSTETNKVSSGKQITSEVKARPPVSIEPYPEFSSVRTFTYTASELTSPFFRLQDNKLTSINEKQPDCLQPQINAVKHPLEKYGLDALRMSGTLLMDDRLWVLIATNDGRVHKASLGTPIGLYYGTISAISSQSITVTQLLPDGTGCWQKKDTLLTRARVAGEK